MLHEAEVLRVYAMHPPHQKDLQPFAAASVSLWQGLTSAVDLQRPCACTSTSFVICYGLTLQRMP